MRQKTVVIIGAGAVGLACAYYLRKREYEVTVVDRNAADVQGCSYGNAGMIVPSHFIPLAAPGVVQMGLRMMPNPRSPFALHFRLDRSLIAWVLQFVRHANAQNVRSCAPTLRDLSLASRAGFEEIAETLDESVGFQKRGLLMLCREQKTLDAEAHVAEQATELGLRAQVLDSAGVAKTDPGITMSVAGGVHFEDDCHLASTDFMLRLREKLKSDGVRFLFGFSVDDFVVRENQIVEIRTKTQDIEASEFILAAGSWSEALGRKLGLKIPVQPGKGYSMTLEHPVEQPHLCSILTEARVAVTPMNNRLRIAGTMEIGAGEEGVNRNRVEGIVDSVPHYFPKFRREHFSDQPVWSGLRPCSPDGMPYVGRTARYKNLCVATGHAMMGLSLAPITGKLITEIISGESSSVELKLLDPDRFNR